MSDKQLKFTQDGGLEEQPEDEDDGPTLRDDGEVMGRFQVKTGENMFLVTSALYKSIRRSSPLLAARCAWSLARSGYSKHVFRTLKTIAMEDIHSSSTEILLIEQYEDWAGEHGSVEWAAIRSALALARAPSSRESTLMKLFFEFCAEERLKDDPDPRFEMPPIPDEARDCHSKEGRKMNRGKKHFALSATRVTDETEIGKIMKRRVLEYQDFIDDPGAIEEAVKNVEPGEHDEPERINQSLDDVDSD